jgi:hypothetical protein
MLLAEQNKESDQCNANQLPYFAGSWRTVLKAVKWSSTVKVAEGNRVFKSETDAARSSLCGVDTIVLLSSRHTLKLGCVDEGMHPTGRRLST